MNQHYWSDADKSAVAEHLKGGLSARSIAAHFKRSRNAVVGLVHRDPILREIGFARAAHGAPKPGRMIAVARKQSLGPSVVRIPLPSGGGAHTCGIPLMSLDAGQCKWPVNEAERGEMHLFCGAASEGSYCQHHAARNIRRAA